MGNCAGKPKGADKDDLQPEPLPAEASASFKEEEETVARENKDGGEKKEEETSGGEREAPLLDVPEEPKTEEEIKTESVAEAAQPTAEDKGEIAAEKKVEAAPAADVAKEPEAKPAESAAAP